MRAPLVLQVHGGPWTQDVWRFERGVQFLWETRLGTSVQGFPITYRASGRQYVMIPTGLGGGSPRRVPGLIAPDINHPTTGDALYVFALPER